MRMPHFAVCIALANLMVLLPDVGSGQAYPNKPIRLITSPAGGGNDLVTRLIAQALSGSLGQPVIVDNRAGILAVETVMNVPADGYAILFIGRTLWAAPLLQKTNYDPLRDFTPIALVGIEPNILVVPPSLPVKSVKELIALAKTRPGELNYATGVVGGSTDLPAKIFAAMAGVNIVRVGYKGGGQALIDLIGGHVQLMFATATSAVTHVKAGKLRALAVTSAQPSALFPGVPTVAASGVPHYESVGMLGAFALTKTPAAIIDRLHQEIVRVLNKPEVKDKLSGMEATNTSTEEFARMIKVEIANLEKVIKEAAIGAD